MLRVGSLQDSDMVARKVAMLEEVTLAAPSYIAEHGTPLNPHMLDGHRMIGFRSSASGKIVPLEFVVEGRTEEFLLPATVSVNAAESYLMAAKLGLGLIQIPRYHGLAAMESGELVEILGEFLPTSTPVSLLYPPNRQLAPRVRVFIEWVASLFREQGGRG